MNAARDIRGDYIKALLEEHSRRLSEGSQEQANAVAVELGKLGHKVDKVESGIRERAINDAPLETAVEGDKPRRGRPAKKASE